MKKNRYSLEKYNSKAAPNSPLELYLIGKLLSRIKSRSVYGNTKVIADEFNLRHALVVKLLRLHATEEAGYKSWRPAQKHKVYRPFAPVFRENCTVTWN